MIPDLALRTKDWPEYSGQLQEARAALLPAVVEKFPGAEPAPGWGSSALFAGAWAGGFLKIVQDKDPFARYARLCHLKRFGSNPAALRVFSVKPFGPQLWAVHSEKLEPVRRDRELHRRLMVMMKKYRWNFADGPEPESAMESDLEYLVMVLAHRMGFSAHIDLGPGNVLIRPDDRCDLVAADPVA